MKIYTYNTDLGAFEIRQLSGKVFELLLEDEKLGEYESPQSAAADVATFNTDYVEWDELENKIERYPKTLEEWTKVEEERPS